MKISSDHVLHDVESTKVVIKKETIGTDVNKPIRRKDWMVLEEFGLEN